MKKYFWIAALLLGAHLRALAQNPEQQRRADSLQIVSLKKILPTLHDTARINCLILLAEKTSDFMRSMKVSADSSYPYAIQANKEAKEIGYKYGLAKSFLLLGGIELLRNWSNLRLGSNDSSHFKAMKQYIWEGVLLAEELKDDGLLAKAYYMWGSTFIEQNNLLFGKNSLQDCIENYKKAVYYYRKIGDEQTEGDICTWLCMTYSEMGEYKDGFEYCEKSLQLSQKLQKDSSSTIRLDYRNWLVQQSIANMADLYKVAGDYETAMTYLRQGRQFAAAHNTKWEMDNEMGELFRLTGQYDSSIYYLKKYVDPKIWRIKLSSVILLGETYMATKEYDMALNLFQGIIDSCRALKNRTGVRTYFGKSLINAGKIYLEKKNYKTALQYIKEGISLVGNNSVVMDGYEPLSQIYHQMGKNDSAYFYLQKYTIMKDSILNKQFIWRLNNYKKEAEDLRKTSQINILDKENQLKDQKLKQQAFVKNALIGGLILFLSFGFFFFRSLSLKRKNERLRLQKDLEMQQLASEKKHAELQHQASELEMQALRAQMNPHFIFNCLSSINRFIFKNDNKTASDYLTRFSRLIRMVLMHSQKKLITLEDELEMLRLYLDLERLRFKDAFDYSITTTNIVDAGAIFIPPLLLQPFCENAVWHGLMHKESKGHLNVIISEVISEDNKVLHCIIEDDGIGREKAAELKSKSAENEKSMGLKITTERLALLNQENNFSTFYRIEDILDKNNEVAGTKVQLKIRYKESIEEFV